MEEVQKGHYNRHIGYYWAVKIDKKEATKFYTQNDLANFIGASQSRVSQMLKHIRCEYNGYIVSKFDTYPGPDIKYFVKDVDTGNVETFDKLQDVADIMGLHWTAVAYIINYEQGLWKNYNIKPEKMSKGKPFLGEERIVDGKFGNTNAGRKCWLTSTKTQETKEFGSIKELSNYIGVSASVIVGQLGSGDGMTCTLGEYIIKAEPMRTQKRHYDKNDKNKDNKNMKKEEKLIELDSGMMLKLCFNYNEILKRQYKKYWFKELYDFLKWMDDNQFVYEELKKINK